MSEQIQNAGGRTQPPEVINFWADGKAGIRLVDIIDRPVPIVGLHGRLDEVFAELPGQKITLKVMFYERTYVKQINIKRVGNNHRYVPISHEKLATTVGKHIGNFLEANFNSRQHDQWYSQEHGCFMEMRLYGLHRVRNRAATYLVELGAAPVEDNPSA